MRNKDISCTLNRKFSLFFQLDFYYISLFPSLLCSFASLKLVAASQHLCAWNTKDFHIFIAHSLIVSLQVLPEKQMQLCLPHFWGSALTTSHTNYIYIRQKTHFASSFCNCSSCMSSNIGRLEMHLVYIQLFPLRLNIRPQNVFKHLGIICAKAM